MAVPTEDQALDNAARLLEQAELQLTNLPLMERLEGLADSWLGMAHMLRERERI